MSTWIEYIKYSKYIKYVLKYMYLKISSTLSMQACEYLSNFCR